MEKTSMRFSVAEIHWADLRQIVRIGIPDAVSVFCLALCAVVVNYPLANYGGEGAMPVWAAFNSFGYLFFSITSSVGSSTRMCNVDIGENDRTSQNYLQSFGWIRVVNVPGLSQNDMKRSV